MKALIAIVAVILLAVAGFAAKAGFEKEESGASEVQQVKQDVREIQMEENELSAKKCAEFLLTQFEEILAGAKYEFVTKDCEQYPGFMYEVEQLLNEPHVGKVFFAKLFLENTDDVEEFMMEGQQYFVKRMPEPFKAMVS